MKKLLTLACVVTIAFTLGGCKDATANIKGSGDALVSVGGSKITKGDIYDALKSSYIGSAALEEIRLELYKKEKLETTDEMKKTADEKLATMKKELGKDFETQIKAAGYNNDEDIMNKMIMPSLLQTELQKKYVSEKADKLFDTYHPLKAQILEAEDETKANDALKALKDGADFKATVKKYGTATTYDGSEKTYTSGSQLPDALWSTMSSLTKTGLNANVIIDSTNNKYYVVTITNNDPNKYKDEAIEAIAQTSAIATECTKYYFDKYDVKFYDIDAYNYFTQQGLIEK